MMWQHKIWARIASVIGHPAALKLHKNQSAVRVIVECFPSGLSVFDKDLRLTYYNQRFRTMLDFPQALFDRPVTYFEDFIRHNAARGEYGEGDVDTIVAAIVERARKTTEHRFERERPNGMTLDIQGAPMPGGGFVTTYTDITARKQADALVRASEERLQRALVASRLSLWEYDIASDGLYLSETWSEMLGGPLTPTTTTFTALGDRVPLQDQSLVVAAMSATLQGTAPAYSIEHRVKKFDGSTVWIRSEGKIVARDANGEPTRALGTNRDITQRKTIELNLQQSKTQLTLVLDSVSEMSIMATNANRECVLFNKGAERLLGYSASEVLGKKIAILFLAPEEVKLRCAEMSARLGRSVEETSVLIDESVIGRESEWTYVRKDGSRFVVALTVNAMHSDSGELLGYMSLGRDVTAQKKYERSLQDAALAAEQLAHAKSAFLATMSHEIRTPMNGVIGMTSLLLETPLSKDQREFTEVIRSSGESLMVVINDILDYSKIEAGKMELEQQAFDLQDAVEGSIDLLALKAQEKRLDLLYLIEPDVPRWIVGDLTRVRQVLTNLISNALKFTETGEVLVQVQRKGDSDTPLTLEFSVKDTGIGIAPAGVSRLFKAFSQVDSSTSRRYGGTGLGLIICKRLVEAMGGELKVESQFGLGTCFYFTMLTQAAPAMEVAPLSHPDDLKGKRVLLVDDNATNLRILSLQAKRWGMEPRTSLSPKEALKILRTGEQFDLLITDLHMPDMDGLAFAEQVRKLRSDLPMALLSSSSLRQTGDDHLFAAVLTKPARQSALFDVFMRALPKAARSSTPGAVHTGAKQFDAELAKRLPMRILVAEDNEVNQKLALRMLRGFGYHADVAANGEEVLDALKRQSAGQHYDLILMDIQMPEMDGLQATRLICASSPYEERPRIVAMSANAMPEDIAIARLAGMDDYITKPVSVLALGAALQKWGARAVGQIAALADDVSPTPSIPPIQPLADISVAEVLNHEQIASVNEMDPSGDFLAELVASFTRNVTGLLARLNAAAQAQNAEEFARMAHQIKGLAANLGADTLAKTSLALEIHSQQHGLTAVGDLLKTLSQDFQQTLVAFDAVLAKLRSV